MRHKKSIGKQGHIRPACLKAAANNTTSKQEEDNNLADQLASMTVNNPLETQQGNAQAVHSLYSTASNQPTPTMLLWLAPQEQPQRQQLISCLPDTGCSQTLISADYAKQLNLYMNNNKKNQLFSANGGNMQVLRSSKIIMKTKSRSIKTEALVLSLIHIWRCRRSTLCRSRWSPYH